jgi:hypothetical protein
MVDLLGWILFLVFGSWIGSLITTYYVANIYRELKKLNQGNQVGPSTSGLSKSFSSVGGSRVSDSKKYCEKCSSPNDMDVTECSACLGSSFVHTKPESQK